MEIGFLLPLERIRWIMHHFFVKKEQIQKGKIEVTGPDVNHIKNVLRMAKGEKLLIGNGEDKDYLSEIVSICPEAIILNILEELEESRELPGRIYLFQGLPKSDKMELIIQKAVELGVYEIIPVSTKRSIVKWDQKKEEGKRKRWQTICENAAKQSKRMMIPKVKEIMSFEEALAYAGEFEHKLIPYEEETEMKRTNQEIQKIGQKASIGIFIGPEGGFDIKEVEMAIENGIVPITLGKRILRTETAGLAVLSIIMFYLENLENN